MSDNYGLNQTRVLDSDNRYFEEVIYQRKKPPLSSEVNLNGKISTVRSQELSRFASPSGCSITGNIFNSADELSLLAGDIVTSPSYNPNSFRLIAMDKGIETGALTAWVNGYSIKIQGTNSTDENNTITLPEPPSLGSRVDFVFLEVWRKLITPSDVIYKYGNLLYGGINPANDLIDPSINIETSLRIQIQYRIRTASCDIENYPDGFDPNQVFVQGPLPYPISSCSHAYFAPVPGDPGLWRAGVGDTAAQESLQTVDGYTYAVPLFAVHRRNTGAYDVDSRSNGAGRSLVDYTNGYASDRPDNTYNNWVAAKDILDMRKRITPTENMKELAEDGFKKLIKGKLRGKMAKQSLGEDHFGTELVQVDAVSNIDRAGSTRIASGDGLRRVFSNAAVSQPETISVRTVLEKIIGSTGTNWAVGDQVQINIQSYPSGTAISSVYQAYTQNGALSGSDITMSSVPTDILLITIPIGSILVDTSFPISFDFTIDFAAGPNGFVEVPETMLEFRKEDGTSAYALQDEMIRLRTSDPVVALDGTKFNMLSSQGGNKTEPYNFGHQMVYHVLGNGTEVVAIPRTIDGFDILGVVSCKTGIGYRTVSVSRTDSLYTVNMGNPGVTLGEDVELTLYTGTKFFETSKQGRGITDTFEMSELIPFDVADGARTSFHIDSTNRSILAVASSNMVSGAGIAYVNGVQKVLETNNADLPTDSTKSLATIRFSGGDVPPSGSKIEIPTLMRSPINTTEGYSFLYHTVPYQGLLDSTATGRIEAVGPSMTTTAGSGLITNYTYTEGTAIFSDSSVVRGVGTQWASSAYPGYTIRNDATPQNKYVIEEVYSNDTLFITSSTDMSSSSSGDSYTIEAKDKPSYNLRNIIDRLPTLSVDTDASGNSDPLAATVSQVSDPYPVLETRVISSVQDVAGLPPNSFWLGTNSADRGRTTVNLFGEEDTLGLGNLGLRFEALTSFSVFQKSYQTYILNKDNGGELFLVVVGSETNNSSAFRLLNEKSDLDSVDIFELPGRPVTMRRIS